MCVCVFVCVCVCALWKTQGENQGVMNGSGQNGSTTTFVDVLIEQKTTTFHNNTASSIPKLKNETAVNNLFQGAKSLTWDLWNPHVIWLFCAALYLSVAVVLVPLAVRRPDSNSSSTRQLFSLAIMFLLASMGYLLQGLGMGQCLILQTHMHTHTHAHTHN